MKHIIIDQKGNMNYHRSGDFHSLFGIVKENDMKPGIVKSNLGKDFIVFNANFSDELDHIKRGPAVMHPKDIGVIISNTGIGVGSNVVDAGSGCGKMAICLARVGCNVTTYERNEEFYSISKKNIEEMNMSIVIKNKDIYEGIDESDLDMINLDLLEPWNALSHVSKSLKSGGFLVCYLPNITQVMKLISELKNDFYLWKVSEILEREWNVNDLKARPNNQMLAHTAFLVFIRKI